MRGNIYRDTSGTWNNIILMTQDPRMFVQKVDFITSPGYLTGPTREQAGLPENSRHYRVITQLDIYKFSQETRQLTLLKAFHGATVPDDVLQSSGFPLAISDRFELEPDPTDEELGVLTCSELNSTMDCMV